MTPLAGLGLICVLFVRKYTLKRNFVKAGDETSNANTKPPPDADEFKDVRERREGESSENASPKPDKASEPQATQDEEKEQVYQRSNIHT